MELYNILLIIFGIILAYLIFIRYKINSIIPKKTEPDMGGAMTIGTRQVQEDCYFMKETNAGRLLVVSDGMGEAYGGRIAARTAIETFRDIFEDYNAFDNPQYFFKKAFHTANKEILKALDNGQNGRASLASTVIYRNKMYYAVVGNVKICVYRKGDLIQVSTGHTVDCLAQKGFLSGKLTRQEGIALLENQRIYNFLGQDGFCEVELFDEPIRLYSDDTVLIMTDGVYDLLSWQDIEEVLKKGGSCSKMALEIVGKINRNSEEEKDNATILFTRIGEVEVV